MEQRVKMQLHELAAFEIFGHLWGEKEEQTDCAVCAIIFQFGETASLLPSWP